LASHVFQPAVFPNSKPNCAVFHRNSKCTVVALPVFFLPRFLRMCVYYSICMLMGVRRFLNTPDLCDRAKGCHSRTYGNPSFANNTMMC
jgi:hypothetical protein